jgi:hypothetical protein
MSEADRLVLVTQLEDDRARMRGLATKLQLHRNGGPAHDRVEQVTSAQILQLRIRFALLESQLAAA